MRSECWKGHYRDGLVGRTDVDWKEEQPGKMGLHRMGWKRAKSEHDNEDKMGRSDAMLERGIDVIEERRQ